MTKEEIMELDEENSKMKDLDNVVEDVLTNLNCLSYIVDRINDLDQREAISDECQEENLKKLMKLDQEVRTITKRYLAKYGSSIYNTSDKYKTESKIKENCKKVENIEENSKRYAYSMYQLDWMIQHGYTLTDLFTCMAALQNRDNKETSVFNLFHAFEQNGFNGELYSCYEEFLDNEYLDNDYMNKLLLPLMTKFNK